jgi:hypothetical protein
MSSSDDIKALSVQLARLETKVDHVLTIVPVVQIHGNRLTKLEALADDKEDHDDRLSALEKRQNYFMGGIGVLGSLGAIVAWFSGVFSDLFR